MGHIACAAAAQPAGHLVHTRIAFHRPEVAAAHAAPPADALGNGVAHLLPALLRIAPLPVAVGVLLQGAPVAPRVARIARHLPAILISGLIILVRASGAPVAIPVVLAEIAITESTLIGHGVSFAAAPNDLSLEIGISALEANSCR